MVQTRVKDDIEQWSRKLRLLASNSADSPKIAKMFKRETVQLLTGNINCDKFDQNNAPIM